MVHAMSSWPTARGKDGLAGQLNGLDKGQIWATLLITIVLSGAAAAIAPMIHIGSHSWITALVGFITLPLTAWVAGTWMARRLNAVLGGLTGDTYGALNEFLEVVALLMLVLLHNLM